MRKIVFVLGAPRSGTTWLQIMLSQNPEIETCQETHIFSSYLSPMKKAWEAHEENNRGIGLQAAISYDEFIYLQRNFSEYVFGKISKDSVVVEKTPAHIRHIEHILEIFPEAHFIHIIRDPRSVVNSLLAASRDWGKNWAAKDVIKNAELWVRDVEAGLQIPDFGKENYYEVKYENIIERTDLELNKLFNWIGVYNDINMCKKISEDTEIKKLQKGNISVSGMQKKEPKGFFRSGLADSWKDELSYRDIALIETISSRLMKRLGYEMCSSGKTHFGNHIDWLRRGIAWRLQAMGRRLAD